MHSPIDQSQDHGAAGRPRPVIGHGHLQPVSGKPAGYLAAPQSAARGALVRMEKQAQQRIYRINPQAMLEFEDWAKNLSRVWQERFDALDQILETEEEVGELSEKEIYR